jgi:hypothetical protein
MNSNAKEDNDRHSKLYSILVISRLLQIVQKASQISLRGFFTENALID